jgi:hypothetical protein
VVESAGFVVVVLLQASTAAPAAVHYDPAASRFPPSSQGNISIPAYFPRLRHVFTGRLRSTNESCSCTKTRFRFLVELGQHTVSKTCVILQALPGGLPDPDVHVLTSMTIPGVLRFYPFVVLSFCRNHHILQIFGRPQWLAA